MKQPHSWTLWLMCLALVHAPGCSDDDGGGFVVGTILVSAFGTVGNAGDTIVGSGVTIMARPGTVNQPTQVSANSIAPVVAGSAAALANSTVVSFEIEADSPLLQPLLVNVVVAGDARLPGNAVGFPFHTVARVGTDGAVELQCDVLVYNDVETGSINVSFSAMTGTYQLVELGVAATLEAANDQNPASTVVGGDDTLSASLETRSEAGPAVSGAAGVCLLPLPPVTFSDMLDVCDEECFDGAFNFVDGFDRIKLAFFEMEPTVQEGNVCGRVCVPEYTVSVDGAAFDGCNLTHLYCAPLVSEAPDGGGDPGGLVVECDGPGPIDFYIEDGAVRVAAACETGICVYDPDDGRVLLRCDDQVESVDFLVDSLYLLNSGFVRLGGDGDLHFTDTNCVTDTIEGDFRSVAGSEFEDGRFWIHTVDGATNASTEFIDQGGQPGGIFGSFPADAGRTLFKVWGRETGGLPVWVETYDDGSVHERNLGGRILRCDDCGVPSDMDGNDTAVCIVSRALGRTTAIDIADMESQLGVPTPGAERISVSERPSTQQASSRVEFLTTNGSANRYRITVVDLATKAIVRNDEYALPTGCTGPVHAIRLPDGRVAIACPGSNHIAIVTPPS